MQTVISVLSECNNDIDAAIKRLGDMRLREDGGPSATPATEPASAAEVGAQHKQPAEGMPQTSSEWVEKLVQEMSASRDVEEARGRGHRFLCAFDSYVNQVRGASHCACREAWLMLNLLWSRCPPCAG